MIRPVLLSLGAVLAISIAACALLPVTGSKGTMPPPGPNGDVDPSAVPDFVAVAGNEGIAGYVAKAAVLGGGADQSWPVYGDDLRTIVGHMVPGRGFVPAGANPATVPTFEVHAGPFNPNASPSPGVVVAYVRNGGTTEASVAVVTNGHIENGSGGFNPGSVGAWCGSVPPGSRLVLLDHSPVGPGASPKQTIYVGVPTTAAVGLSIDVGPTGVAGVGTGIPDWWTGGPPPC